MKEFEQFRVSACTGCTDAITNADMHLGVVLILQLSSIYVQ